MRGDGCDLCTTQHAMQDFGRPAVSGHDAPGSPNLSYCTNCAKWLFWKLSGHHASVADFLSHDKWWSLSSSVMNLGGQEDASNCWPPSSVGIADLTGILPLLITEASLLVPFRTSLVPPLCPCCVVRSSSP